MIERAAAGFAEFIEACLIQYFVQLPIERMARSFRQIPAIPQLLLSLTPPACSHRRAPNLTLDPSQRKVIKLQRTLAPQLGGRGWGKSVLLLHAL